MATSCLMSQGQLVDYEKSPAQLQLADGATVDSLEWPSWHWRSHAPSAGPACSAIFVPLLSVGGGWNLRKLVATACTSWRDEVQAWRAEVSAVTCSEPCPGLLRLIATTCPRLRRLECDGLGEVALPALRELGEWCERLEELVVDVLPADRSPADAFPTASAVLRTVLETCPGLGLLQLIEGWRLQPPATGDGSNGPPSQLEWWLERPEEHAEAVRSQWPRRWGGAGRCATVARCAQGQATHAATASRDLEPTMASGLFCVPSGLAELELGHADRVDNAVVATLAKSCTRLAHLPLRECPTLTDGVFEPLQEMRSGALRRLCSPAARASHTSRSTMRWCSRPAELRSRGRRSRRCPRTLRRWASLNYRRRPSRTRSPSAWSQPAVVGRSRSALIRVGHLAEMPYVSSRHPKLLTVLKWEKAAPSASCYRPTSRRPSSCGSRTPRRMAPT